MRTLLLVGSLAAGVLLFVYEYLNRREQEAQHGHHNGRRNLSDEDIVIIDENTAPKELQSRVFVAPKPDEVCCICLDNLIRKNTTKKIGIVALPVCGHWFHQKCAIRLLEYHPNCPVCRVNIDISMLRSTPVRIAQALDNESNEQPLDIPSSSTSVTSSTTASRLLRNSKDD